MTTLFLRPGWRAHLAALAVGLGCAPSLLAQPLPYLGRWLPDDPPATQASAASLHIDDATLTWRGPDKAAPSCVQPFEMKKEKPGTVYTDGRGRKFVAGSLGSLPTYLLTLGANACGGADEVRVSFPLVYDIDHIEFIEYVKGKPVSSRRFHRQPDAPAKRAGKRSHGKTAVS